MNSKPSPGCTLGSFALMAMKPMPFGPNSFARPIRRSSYPFAKGHSLQVKITAVPLPPRVWSSECIAPSVPFRLKAGPAAPIASSPAEASRRAAAPQRPTRALIRIAVAANEPVFRVKRIPFCRIIIPPKKIESRHDRPAAAAGQGRAASRTRGPGGPDLVVPVERGHLVALGEGRVVEDVVDEVVDQAVVRHDRLADVHQLGGAGADDMHPEKPARLAMEQDLQQSRIVAQDGAAGDLAIARDAGLVRHAGGGQLFLGAA